MILQRTDYIGIKFHENAPVALTIKSVVQRAVRAIIYRSIPYTTFHHICLNQFVEELLDLLNSGTITVSPKRRGDLFGNMTSFAKKTIRSFVCDVPCSFCDTKKRPSTLETHKIHHESQPTHHSSCILSSCIAGNTPQSGFSRRRSGQESSPTSFLTTALPGFLLVRKSQRPRDSRRATSTHGTSETNPKDLLQDVNQYRRH